MEIIRSDKLNDLQMEKCIDIFIEGFKHLMTFAKSEEELKKLFSKSFNKEYLYAAVNDSSKVLGIIGVANNKVRPIRFDPGWCRQIYGTIKGTILSKEMNMIFQSQAVKADTDLYVDILATASEARGMGVATTLLQFAFSMKGYSEAWIEVLSKNLNARRLYEKVGFTEYSSSRHSFIAKFGYGYPIKMKLALRTDLD